MKKLDIKTVFIIVLGVALIISIIFNQKNNTKTYEDEISKLHKNNLELVSKNDSIKKVNLRLDSEIVNINKLLKVNVEKLTVTQIELDKLNKRRNEIPKYVNSLSADGVSNAFSDFLENSKSSNHN